MESLAIYILYLLILILGVTFGSFYGVLADRIKSDGTLTLNALLGRSKCDYCKKLLGVLDLVPVFSILVSKFKCRHCKANLSSRYLVYEIVTGLIFTLAFYTTVGTNIFSVSSYLLFLFLVVNFSCFYLIFLADLKYQVIPNIYVLIGLIFTIVFTLANHIFRLVFLYTSLKADPFGRYLLQAGYFRDQLIYLSTPLLYTLLGSLFIYIFFYLLHVLTKGRGMGGGDVKLSFYLAFFMGFPIMFVGTFLAFLIGALFGIVLIIIGNKKFGQRIAFGPFMILACVITYYLGDQIWLWYTNLL